MVTVTSRAMNPAAQQALWSKLAVTLVVLLSAAYASYQATQEAAWHTSYLWDVLRVWGWELLLVLAWCGLGHWLRKPLLKSVSMTFGERVMWTVALGVVGWVLWILVLGSLGGFHPVWIVASACLFACGLAAPLARVVLVALKKPPSVAGIRFTLIDIVCLAVALVGIAMVYLPLLSANSVSTDAAWFHLSSAEDYARAGRLIPLPGDYAKCIPQLSSLLHVFAFVVPGLPESQRWVLSLHTEFVLFLFTLHAVNVSVGYVWRRPVRWSFVIYLLFPSLYIYDSNLGGGADHIIAFFVAPQLIAALRALEERSHRLVFLSGVCGGAALMTKLQAVYVIVPLGLWFLINFVGGSVKRRKITWSPITLGLVYTAAALGTFSPHCLKNWIFYDNPFYPFLMDVIPSNPSFAEASQLFREHYPPYEREMTWETIKTSLELSITHPFTLLSIHGAHRPYVGMWFVLLTPAALFVRSWRNAAFIFCAWGAVFYWAYAFPAVRNMHTFFPLLVTVAAVGALRVWASGAVARLSLLVMCFVQFSTSFDHIVEVNQGKWNDVFRLITFKERSSKVARFDGYRRDYRELRKIVPEDGKVLLHTFYSQLGIMREVVLDWPGFQGYIDYRPAQTPKDIYQILHERDITHIVEVPRWPAHSRQEDVLFLAFLHNYAERIQQVGEFVVWKMPEQRPPHEESYQVLIWDIPRFTNGLYSIQQLDQLDDGPPLPRSPHQPFQDGKHAIRLLAEASAAVISNSVKLSTQEQHALQHLRKVRSYAGYQVYVRPTVHRSDE